VDKPTIFATKPFALGNLVVYSIWNFHVISFLASFHPPHFFAFSKASRINVG
jgi:hypothetical protein